MAKRARELSSLAIVAVGRVRTAAGTLADAEESLTFGNPTFRVNRRRSHWTPSSRMHIQQWPRSNSYTTGIGPARRLKRSTHWSLIPATQTHWLVQAMLRGFLAT